MTRLTVHRNNENPTVITRPLFSSSVQAGFPSPAEDYIESSLDLNTYLIKNPAATFFVRVSGSSMKDALIFPGDILLVDRSLTPRSGRVVIAVIDGELTVKRLLLNRTKTVLKAENNEFADIDIAPESEFEIWGVVTHIIHEAL